MSKIDPRFVEGDPIYFIHPYVYVNWQKLQRSSYPRVPQGWSKRSSFYHLYPACQDTLDIIAKEAGRYLYLHREPGSSPLSSYLDLAHVSFLLFLKNLDEQKSMLLLPKTIDVATDPYPYQIEMLKLVLTRKASALFCEPRTGKTKVIIDAYREKKKQGVVDKCLVICPRSGLWVWDREIKKHSFPKEFTAVVVRGTKDDRKEMWSEFPRKDFYLTNYEIMKADFSQLYNLIDDYTFLILDEAHKIKSPSAKQSEAAVRLGEETSHKSILTGTPVGNNAYDTWNLYRFLDRGDTFGIVYSRYIEKWFWRNGYKLIPYFETGKAFNEIHYHQEGHLAIRYTQKETDAFFPEFVDDIRVIDMTSIQKKVYKQVQDAIEAEIEEESKAGFIKTSSQILAKFLRLAMVSCGFVTAREAINLDECWDGDKFVIPIPGENPKMQALDDIISEVGIYDYYENGLSNGNKPPKLIIWSRFVWNIKQIEKFLEKKEIRFLSLFGETREKDRINIDERFNEDPNITVFLGQPQSGGMSLDLSGATTQVYFSNDFSLLNRIQSSSRLKTPKLEHRSIRTIDLCCKGTIDFYIANALQQKKSIADLVNRDSWREFLKEGGEDLCQN